MDTLDAKTRIMNEIDSIDVQVQALQEKIAELHSHKNQFKEAYTAIVAAEQRAETLLSGLLKAAPVEQPEGDDVWEAPAEEETEGEEQTRFVPVYDRELSLIEADPEDENSESENAAESEMEGAEEVNGKRKLARPIPSFLRQYL